MKFLFHYLSLLNIVDAILTYYGLERGLIEEMNPFMDKIYRMDSEFLVLTKISLSFLLYLFLYFEKVPSSRVVKGLGVFAALLYTTVFGLHCTWLLLV